MPRYFFDFHALTLSIRDEEGAECANPRAVSTEAMGALCQIAGDHPDRYAGQTLHVVVRDANNRTVFTASLNLASAWNAERQEPQAA
ncbi:DUF6894 family protein [Methylobacterium nigriterrae]|uniref:DUF6894 family protein n=1 Tax=Methylobacterium nigriterrae TaxID=3127512 RepID=UPI003D66FFB9